MIPYANLIRDVLNYRIKIGAKQKAREREKKLQQENGFNESLAGGDSVVVVDSQDGLTDLATQQDQAQNDQTQFPIFSRADVRNVKIIRTTE